MPLQNVEQPRVGLAEHFDPRPTPGDGPKHFIIVHEANLIDGHRLFVTAMEKPAHGSSEAGIFLVSAECLRQTLNFDQRHSGMESAKKLFFEVIDHLANVRVNFHAIFNKAAGVKDVSRVGGALSFRAQRGICCSFGSGPAVEGTKL